MDRRNFLRTGMIGVFTTSFAPGSILEAINCNVTSPDILGPYWTEGHPYRTVLANAEEPGTRVFISGRVLASDCETPINNAIVDVWHANDEGCYTIFMECDSGNIDEDPYNLRGIISTNENGEYAFESIWPGYYAGRPRHFHYKVTTLGGTELVTQCYFEDDPQIDDEWQDSHSDLVIPLVETEDGLVGVFDIVMDEETVDIGVDKNIDIVPQNMTLYHAYPNPFNNSTKIKFNISSSGHVSIGVYDSSGRYIVRIIEKKMSKGTHSIDWKGIDNYGKSIPSGSYLIVMKYAGSIISRKISLIK
tara:strand:+ start:1904 stop:2815 length:912 start_codon:yes stop_codon:yes gene_type:complete